MAGILCFGLARCSAETAARAWEGDSFDGDREADEFAGCSWVSVLAGIYADAWHDGCFAGGDLAGDRWGVVGATVRGQGLLLDAKKRGG
jgi:hypothetical protein